MHLESKMLREINWQGDRSNGRETMRRRETELGERKRMQKELRCVRYMYQLPIKNVIIMYCKNANKK